MRLDRITMRRLARLPILPFAIAVLLTTTAGTRAQETEDTPPVDIQIGVSVDTVPVSSDFSGTNITVFGAIENADRADLQFERYDLAVAIRGPDENIVVRRKERVFGIWVNRQARTYASVPAFYTVASSRPLDRIAPEAKLREAQLGITNVPLNLTSLGPNTSYLPAPEFAGSLRRIRAEEGLFAENARGIAFLGSSLFRATLRLPSNVPIGLHRVSVFLYRDGELIASRGDEFEVRKVGLEQFMFTLAHSYGLWYGMIAVLLALAIGWLGSVIFGRNT